MCPAKRSWQAMFTLFLLLTLALTSLPVHVRAQESPEPTSHRDPMPLRLADLLDPLGGACDAAWAYDAQDDADPWKQWPGDLIDVDETLGLWLHLTEPAILPVTGRQPASTTVELRAGWNLVGYPAQTARPVAEALSSIDGLYTRVMTLDAADPGDPWKEYNVHAPPYANDLLLMEPGQGYWIHVTEDCTWTVQP